MILLLINNLDKFSQHLKFKSFEDWYSVSPEDFAEFGGKSLLREFYGNSVAKAVCTIYPEFNWDVWRFGKVLFELQ